MDAAGTGAPRQPGPDTLRFRQAFDEELREVRSRRRLHYLRGEADRDPRQTLAGLALSGGGIRSATFCLGLLQGFADRGFLRVFDYLSTVSGGGFAGAWWTACLSRNLGGEPQRLFPPAEQIAPGREEDYRRRRPEAALAAGHDPIHHVRLFSNYLTPRKGLLSGDTWRAVAVATRNLLLTWLILLPVLFAAVLLAQLYYVVQPFAPGVAAAFSTQPTVDGAALAARAAVAARPVLVLLIGVAFVTALWMRYNNAGTPATHAAGTITFVLIVAALVALAGTPAGGAGWSRADATLAVAALALGAWAWYRIAGPAAGRIERAVRSAWATRVHALLLLWLAAITAVVLVGGFAHEFVARAASEIGRAELTTKSVASVVAVLASLGGALATALRAAPTGGRDARECAEPGILMRMVFALTPPLVLVVLVTGVAWLAHTALVNLVVVPARLGLTTLGALAGISLAVVFAAWEAGRDRAQESGQDGAEVPGIALAAAGAGGLTATVSVLGMWWSPPAPLPDVRSLLAAAVPVLLAAAGVAVEARRCRARNGRVMGLLAFASVTAGLLGISAALGSLGWARSVPLYAAAVLIGLTGGWVVALGWMADPNALSLHTFYRARLVRAFLGASNAARRETGCRITDPAEGDDIRLHQLGATAAGGPYHLVNTTLNLVGGQDLATAQRAAAAFVLAPRACGSLRTGYRPTKEYMSGTLTLGAAIAASGAAVSPTMGARTRTATLSMLLAFLNVRLGFWAPNPAREHWRVPQTRLWPFYLLRESLSQTNDVGAYCYLTDGGHFDNTGLYSLVERGCRYIVVCDSGADPDASFEDLGTAIRRCRIDFGLEVTIAGAGFIGVEGVATARYAVGTLRYAEAHVQRLGWDDLGEAARAGILVWIRPVLTRRETLDVEQYGRLHRRFPHQSTADQWFDEAQFESYRKLGELTAAQALESAAERTAKEHLEPLASPAAALTGADVAALFSGFLPRPGQESRPERARGARDR